MAAELMLIRSDSGVLLPANDDAREAIGKLRIGQGVIAEIRAARNLQFHRKAFALFGFAFDHWDHAKTALIRPSEERLLRHFVSWLAKNGLSAEAVAALMDGYMEVLARSRSERNSAAPDRDEFRKWLIVEAGHHREVLTPQGAVRVAKSLKFGSMDETEFQAVYQSVLNVVWDKIFRRANYKSAADVDAAVNQLMGF